MKFKHSLAGVTFEGRQELLSHFAGETITVEFEEEPENKFDPNAVAVYYGESKLGYLPKENALYLHKNSLMVEDEIRMKVDSFDDEDGNIVFYAKLMYEAEPLVQTRVK